MTTTTETSMPRLKARYREEIAPALRQEFGFANVMQVPTLTKIVVNMGVGDAARDSKLIEGAVKDKTNPAFRSKYADLFSGWSRNTLC